MQRIRSVIIDDERLARENLRIILNENFAHVEIIGTAGGVAEGAELIRKTSPELIFLDIRMPSGVEGFDLLDMVANQNFQVIFVTAFHDYAIKAFNANALHYVLKPIDVDDLTVGINKVLQRRKLFEEHPSVMQDYQSLLKAITSDLRLQTMPSRITINHSKGFKVIEEADIVCLEAQGNCTMLHFKNKERYLDTRTLKVYENLLNSSHFYRIHKSHIVNLNYLKEYITEDGPYVVMSNAMHIPVARKRMSDFTERVKSQF